MDDLQKKDIPERNPLRYHETLDAFAATIESNFSEREITVYRTVMTDPPTEQDLTPQKFRNRTPGQIEELLIEYTPEDIEELSEKERLSEVGHHALSVNISEDKCRKEAVRAYRGVKKKYPPEIAEEYKTNRGPFIAQFHITPEAGMISEFNKNGHANYLVREGISIEDIWVKDYPLQPVNYDEEPIV